MVVPVRVDEELNLLRTEREARLACAVEALLIAVESVGLSSLLDMKSSLR